MERGEAAATCGGRLFHRWVAATENAMSPTLDRQVCQMSRDVNAAEHSHRLASVSACQRSSSQISWPQTMSTLYAKTATLLICDALRSFQPVKSAEQRANVVKAQWREYQPSGRIHYQLKSLQKVRYKKSSQESTSETTTEWRTGRDQQHQSTEELICISFYRRLICIEYALISTSVSRYRSVDTSLNLKSFLAKWFQIIGSNLTSQIVPFPNILKANVKSFKNKMPCYRRENRAMSL